METTMKAQIVKVIEKILSDSQMIYSKVKNPNIDPIKGPEILKKLTNVKDLIEELSQMELEDVNTDAINIPEIISVCSASPSELSTTTPSVPTCTALENISDHLELVELSDPCIDLEDYFGEYNEFVEPNDLDTLFDHLELDEFADICNNDNENSSDDSEYSDHESLQAWPCSIRDICDYDSDTGICEY